jgi:5-formyltetrahydrofolate cyclo-ligase
LYGNTLKKKGKHQLWGRILQHNTLATRKAETRTKLKQIRASIAADLRTAYSGTITRTLLNLAEIQAARAIFLFISYGNEVHTHELIKHFLNEGKILAVPKILPTKTMIAVAFRCWSDLAPGELGILTPSGEIPYTGDFGVVITPGLGFTTKGHRIGYGRGYYDKWFACHKVNCKIAITFEEQIIDKLPVDDADIMMDMIVTEKRIIRTNRQI